MARTKQTFIDTHVYLEADQHAAITQTAKKERRSFAEQLRLIVDKFYSRKGGNGR